MGNGLPTRPPASDPGLPKRIAGLSRLGYQCIGPGRPRPHGPNAMMSIDPFRSELAHEEFRALRATIRERGTLRLLVVLITFVAWATLAMLSWRGGLSVSFGA